MQGLMMEVPLLISSLIRHADRYHGDAEIVSRTVEGPIHRYTYRDAHVRARRLARALARLGVAPSDRVATLAWNGYRHFELYYAISGMGAITHTINPRLFHDQLTSIIRHAEDKIVFFDLGFSALVEQLAAACKGVKHWVAMTDHDHLPQMALPGLLCYEDLVAAESDDFDWPEFDENTAAALCYTSGTTGKPKGVLFSHRSSLLHAYAISLPDTKCLSASSAVLAIVPMFHVNAWGIPYAAPLVGCKLVFPGPALDGASLYQLLESEAVDSTSAVPTVWMNLLNYVQQNKLRFSTLRHTTIGGSACPPALIKTLSQDLGVRVMHGWGMTEMSPVGTLNAPKRKHADCDAEEQFQLSLKHGRPPFGVDMKVVDGEGNELPRDGKSAGNLLVRGPWILRR